MTKGPLIAPIVGGIIALLLSGCVTASVSNDIPPCDRLIPKSLTDDTPAADLPETRQLPDGHDDAQPWQVGFLAQSGQLEIANTKPKAVDHIYRECLAMHRDAKRRAERGFFGRLFGG